VSDALSVSPAADFFCPGPQHDCPISRWRYCSAPFCIAETPAQVFDPGGATSTIALRLSLMERDVQEADRVLAACRHEKLDDNGLSGVAGALDGYTVPKRLVCWVNWPGSR